MKQSMTRKVLILTVLALLMFGSVFASAAMAANCTDWVTEVTYDSFCDNTDGCGWFWQKDTEKHWEYQTRICYEDGNYYLYERYILVKDGCCD